jgi:hypothetical protein
MAKFEDEMGPEDMVRTDDHFEQHQREAVSANNESRAAYDRKLHQARVIEHASNAIDNLRAGMARTR